MEYKIETNGLNQVELNQYNNDDGTILFTGSMTECIEKLKETVLSNQKTANYIYDTATGQTVSVDNHGNQSNIDLLG